MAHLEDVEEDIDSPSVLNVIEDQPLASLHGVEDFTRSIAQLSEKSSDAFRLLAESHKVDVSVLALKSSVSSTGAS